MKFFYETLTWVLLALWIGWVWDLIHLPTGYACDVSTVADVTTTACRLVFP